jgi:hypothetical protein
MSLDVGVDACDTIDQLMIYQIWLLNVSMLLGLLHHGNPLFPSDTQPAINKPRPMDKLLAK